MARKRPLAYNRCKLVQNVFFAYIGPTKPTILFDIQQNKRQYSDLKQRWCQMMLWRHKLNKVLHWRSTDADIKASSTSSPVHRALTPVARHLISRAGCSSCASLAKSVFKPLSPFLSVFWDRRAARSASVYISPLRCLYLTAPHNPLMSRVCTRLLSSPVSLTARQAAVSYRFLWFAPQFDLSSNCCVTAEQLDKPLEGRTTRKRKRKPI